VQSRERLCRRDRRRHGSTKEPSRANERLLIAGAAILLYKYLERPIRAKLIVCHDTDGKQRKCCSCAPEWILPSCRLIGSSQQHYRTCKITTSTTLGQTAQKMRPGRSICLFHDCPSCHSHLKPLRLKSKNRIQRVSAKIKSNPSVLCRRQVVHA
jgi:hypothetical protein